MHVSESRCVRACYVHSLLMVMNYHMEFPIIPSN